MPEPSLTIQCQECEDGTRYTSRYGGSDPDVYPVPARFSFPRGWCEACESTGSLTLKCEDWRCDADAVEMVDDAPWCRVHADEQTADALVVGDKAL